MFVFLPNPRTLASNDETSNPGRVSERLAEMAPHALGNPTTSSCCPQHTPIGYEPDGTPVYLAAGGRNNGMEFLVDDGDGDEPDEFDDDEDDSGDDDGDSRSRNRRKRPPAARRRQRAEPDDEDDADEDDAEDEDLDDEDDQRDGDEDDDWEPPTREQWERVQASVSRNNGELMKRRLAAKTLKKLNLADDETLSDWMISRGLDPETGDFIEGHDGNSDEGRQRLAQDSKRAEQRGAARAEARYKPAIVQFAAAAALDEAGYSGKNKALALKLLDIDQVDIEFDNNGEPVVYGLDEQVTAVKADFPELFRTRRIRPGTEADAEADGNGRAPARSRGTARRVGGARAVDGGERRKPAPKVAGWLQQVDRQMQGLPPGR